MGMSRLFMVSRTLAYTGAAERGPPSGLVVDLMWAHATAEDRLEHIRAASSADRVDLVFFISAHDEREAADQADRLCARAAGAGSTLGAQLHRI